MTKFGGGDAYTQDFFPFPKTGGITNKGGSRASEFRNLAVLYVEYCTIRYRTLSRLYNTHSKAPIFSIEIRLEIMSD